MIGFLWGLLGAVFGAGVAWGAMRQKMAKHAADLNGMGKKLGRLMAEQIIQAKDDPDFPSIVRKLIYGG